MAGRILPLKLQDKNGVAETQVPIVQLVIAGWTGRDAAAVEKHIVELEALGVKRPLSVPIFYRVSAARATIDDSIEASGDKSSGEVEFMLLRTGGKLWVGVGSDHTDREVETYGVTVSKQMCDKPIAATFWLHDEVAAHWDRLMLRSFIRENGARVLYQEGPVTGMRAPEDLIGRYAPGGLPEGTLMSCGTHAVKGGIRPSDRFEFELDDPVLGRTIRGGYDIRSLPVLG